MVAQINNPAGLAIDTQPLAKLRAQAKQSPDQALKAAAQQFESVFINMMLKSMRDATPQDGMMDSDQTRMFTGMLDQQLSQSISAKGVGLADILVKQLGGKSTPVIKQQVLSPPAYPQAAPANTVQPAPADLQAVPSAFNANTQQDFISRMLPLAKQASLDSGVPPQLMLGQAALESGWGKREIRMADGGNSYNLFGIKATPGWTGKVAEVVTTEYKDGVAQKLVQKFRAYSSYADAFQDYGKLIGGNPRYAGVLQQGGDNIGMAQAIQKAGYATDPKYADKLARVMVVTSDLLTKIA